MSARKMERRVIPRRLYIDTEPRGYLESDMDYLLNNAEVAVQLLDAALAAESAEVSNVE